MRTSKGTSDARQTIRRCLTHATVWVLLLAASPTEAQWTTPFYGWGVTVDCLDQARAIIASGTNVNARFKDGATFLQSACYLGHPEVCELLIQNGADPNIATSNGMNALHWAVTFNACEMLGLDAKEMSRLRQGKEEVCGLLLRNGAKLEAKDSEGNTPLHWAAGGHILSYFPEDVNRTVCELLIRAGANVNATNHEEQTPMHRFVRWRVEWTNVCETLATKGANLNMKDEDGWTPLHHAAANNMVNVCKVLLAHGADANARTKKNETPRDLTDSRAVEELLEKYAPTKGTGAPKRNQK